MKELAVVGGSLAGIRCVEAARRLGFTGTIHLVEPDAEAPYDRPPFSKRFLRDAEVTPSSLHSNSLDDLQLVIHRQPATALDADEVMIGLADGTVLEPDAIVIATGSSPRMLSDTPGAHLGGIHVLRSANDARALRSALSPGARLVIIGAGFIGLEVAATARAMECQVTVIEALDAPLERGVGATVGSMIGEWHRAHGVDIRCGTQLEGFSGAGVVDSVHLGDGTTIPADLVLVGIGTQPNTAWLANSGLRFDDGVLCDATLCARPNIFAIGDVARFEHPRYGSVRFEHWTNAVESGMFLAQSLFGGQPPTPYAPLPFVWSDQYDVTFQVIGAPGKSTEVSFVTPPNETFSFLALYERAGLVTGAVAANQPKALTRVRRAMMVNDPPLGEVLELLSDT
ncbi:MAG: FAD-dependent oxidoreductase [Acidimicrobiia bacterium]